MENKDDYALLRVIAASVETIKEDIKEMKEGLKGKVEVTDFLTLKTEVEDLKKKSWFAAGFAGAISFIASHILK